jgi:uncharacterized membrane protein
MADENRMREQAALDESHKDPANWKLGIFYFNKADPRLMPPKRIPGLGYTVNFANWKSVLILILMVAASAGLVEGLIFLLNRKH